MDLDEAGVPEVDDEAAIESYETFAENAVAKARYFHRRSGLPAVADDSGLEVRALGGAPGVRSRRWAARDDLRGQALDDANNAKLLASLAGMEDRRARYVCAAAYHDAGHDVTAEGAATGTIIEAARGVNGFGYDPYFLSDDLGRTFAEASTAEKDAVSHRGRAFHALLSRLPPR
jgi:XTP/dITP diphosphohydrolase